MNGNRSTGFFCPLPWVSLSTGPGGRLRTCCHQSTPPDEDTLSAISEIHSLRHNDAIRSELLRGQTPAACSNCARLEQEGGESPRLEYIRRFGTEDLGSIRYLDLTIDNLCNLECIMCSPLYSTRLNASFSGIYPNYEKMPAWSLPLENLIPLISHLPRLEMMTLTGGEPFLSPNVQKLLSHCVDSGVASKLSLRIFSNFTVRPPWMIEMLSAFRDCEILASIDAIGEIYEKIRHPAKWHLVEENLNWLIQNRTSNIQVRLHSVAMAPGWVGMGDLLRFTAKTKGLSCRIPSVTLLASPIHLRPDVLPEHEYEVGCEGIRDALRDLSPLSEEELSFDATWRSLLVPRNEDIYQRHSMAYRIFTRKRSAHNHRYNRQIEIPTPIHEG